MSTIDPAAAQRHITLCALCDTVVPTVARDEDPDGFWARTATDLGVDEAALQFMATMPDAQRQGLGVLLDAFTALGLAGTEDQATREAIIRGVAQSSPEAGLGVAGLIALIQFLHYGLPDPKTGRNVNWDVFAYPGPPSPPPNVDKPIVPLIPDGDTTLDADVVVVGSGAGGGVIAGRLAQEGLSVVVLEAGGYFNESDFSQYELQAYQDLYWRGGPVATADANVTLLSGTALGGGTVVNWTNCLRTPDWVRQEWASEHGLDGVDGADFDAHLDAVLQRAGATDACSDLNGPHQRMIEGCEALGLRHKTIIRNASPDGYSPQTAGFMGFGDQSGSKRSIDKTFLLDAFEAGARILVRCKANEVIVSDGRAAGVRATGTDAAGEAVSVTVNAPRVVVACGALDSPALLLRSKIGGPAVGDYFRFHTCTSTFGLYGEDQEAWWGAPQAALCHHYDNPGDGYGFMIEGSHYSPGLIGSSIWPGGEAHKELMTKFRYGAAFISLTRDHGHGKITIDEAGESLVSYPIDDPLDQENLRRGIDVQMRLHEAAGASEIYAIVPGVGPWRRGDDLDAYIAMLQEIPLRAGGWRLFAAHQMGSCRMGADPSTSVAGPSGELHDTPGVWIGDASAFPTTSGVNPMVTVMALAHRTAQAIADQSRTGGEPARTEPAPA
jgi:choline dehydrogenase-like flavoprotein